MCHNETVTKYNKKIFLVVAKVLDENLIVAGVVGIIMASTDPVRVGNFHEGASIVVKTGKKLEIKKEDVKKLKGVKAGVGVIGITGNPQRVGQHGNLLKNDRTANSMKIIYENKWNGENEH